MSDPAAVMAVPLTLGTLGLWGLLVFRALSGPRWERKMILGVTIVLVLLVGLIGCIASLVGAMQP